MSSQTGGDTSGTQRVRTTCYPVVDTEYICPETGEIKIKPMKEITLPCIKCGVLTTVVKREGVTPLVFCYFCRPPRPEDLKDADDSAEEVAPFPSLLAGMSLEGVSDIDACSVRVVAADDDTDALIRFLFPVSHFGMPRRGEIIHHEGKDWRVLEVRWEPEPLLLCQRIP